MSVKCSQSMIILVPLRTYRLHVYTEREQNFGLNFLESVAGSAVVEDPVIVERIEHLRIMTIGINRPKKRNCVNEVLSSGPVFALPLAPRGELGPRG
jgi:hypothetical protein